jgi:tol-pal system protein YbgF
MALLVALIPGCATARHDTRSGASAEDEAKQLVVAVERLRLERRLRERKIRDLEHQLAAAPAAPRATSVPPALPVEVLQPTAEGRANATVDGERLVGLADDGSEIIYIEDAASGHLVQPSPEALAEVGRDTRRPVVSSQPRDRLDGPDIDEGPARSLLDGANEDRIPRFPAPLASVGRRTARARAAPGRTVPSVRGADHGNADGLYRAAVAMVRRAEYPQAVVQLREFLRLHPAHDYSDNAQYWLGETFYAQQQYDQALIELRRVIEKYPQGNKVPDALLKVGYCHQALGDRAKAAAVLRELIRLFPTSEPAALAVKKLEESSK